MTADTRERRELVFETAKEVEVPDADVILQPTLRKAAREGKDAQKTEMTEIQEQLAAKRGAVTVVS